MGGSPLQGNFPVFLGDEASYPQITGISPPRKFLFCSPGNLLKFWQVVLIVDEYLG
jgi:hypothetical protein